jgi:hypothetical protein
MAAVGIVASQLLPLFARLVAGPRKAQSPPVFLSNLRHDAANAIAQAVLSVTFLAYQAFETAHAIGLTLVRLVVTKRRLSSGNRRGRPPGPPASSAGRG